MLPVEAGGLRTPSNLERGGVSEQGLSEAKNRWLTGSREAEITQPSPIVGSQHRSAEGLPPLRGGNPPREAPEKNQVEENGGLLIDLPSDDGDEQYFRLE